MKRRTFIVAGGRGSPRFTWAQRKRCPRKQNEMSSSFVRRARPRQTRTSLPLAFLISDAESLLRGGGYPRCRFDKQEEEQSRKHCTTSVIGWCFGGAQFRQELLDKPEPCASYPKTCGIRLDRSRSRFLRTNDAIRFVLSVELKNERKSEAQTVRDDEDFINKIIEKQTNLWAFALQSRHRRIFDLDCYARSKFSPGAEKLNSFFGFVHRPAIVFNNVPFGSTDALASLEYLRPIQIVISVSDQTAVFLFR